MQILKDFLAHLNLGQPVAFHDLNILPVFNGGNGHMPFIEIEEALQQGLAEITEVSESGSVPNLQVTNKSHSDIIILDGEELIGAKQNRIVNTTIVVGAQTSVIAPVSCVEQGRWRYTSRSFSTGDSFMYPSLRKAKMSAVTSSLRNTGNLTADQSQIWDDIAMKSQRLNVTSHTMSMSDIYDSRVEESMSLKDEIPYKEKQVGFLAFIRGGFAGGDVFGAPELCRKKLHKLLRSYYLDSLDRAVSFPDLKVEQVFEQINAAPQEQFATVGKGAELRFEAHDVQGAWKLVDNYIPHLMVFPKK